MKIFIVCVLLPCLISGLPSSTEKWDKDDAFTLDTDTTPQEEGQDETKIGRVPLTKSDTPRIIKQDEIFPMILQQLLEESLKNEVMEATKGKNTPLTYMTPPPPLEQKKENEWADEADSVTTTTDNVSGMGEGQSVSVGTEGSQESSESATTPQDSYMSYYLPKQKQYADKYPLYISTHHSSEDLEHQPSTNTFQIQEPETKENRMDKVILGGDDDSKSEESQQKPMVPEEPSDELEPTTSAPIFLDQTTTEETAVASEQTVDDSSEKTDNRPIYYLIFRPRTSGMDPASYPNSMYSRGMLPQQSQFSNFAPMRRSYRYPSFIAQDYEDQVPSNSQYYPTPMSFRYQYQPSFYNGMSGYNNYQQYPFMQMSSRYDSPYYNSYNYNNRDRDLYTSASSFAPYYRMTRSPSPYYPQTYNNYNYQQPYPTFGMRSFNGYGYEGFQNPYYA